MKLLLFDIDGTLLVSNGAGRRAMNKCLSSMMGIDTITLKGIDFGGRTDQQIIFDILLANGMNKEEANEALPDALDAYIAAFTNAFEPHFVSALEGAVELVKTLAEYDHVQLALLTGNVEKTAYIKVDAIGLDGYFPFGAFGNDFSERSMLPQLAVDRAREFNGHSYKEKDIVIIGDTKHDILCGKALNVFSVAVSTGHYKSGDLSQYNPDILMDDLSNTDKFIELVV